MHHRDLRTAHMGYSCGSRCSSWCLTTPPSWSQAADPAWGEMPAPCAQWPAPGAALLAPDFAEAVLSTAEQKGES